MSYSEPILNQIVVLFRALGIGIVLGTVYFLLSLVRKLFAEKRWICYTCDIVFWVISFYISFIFMLVYNKGLVRITLIAGELAGAAAFHYSLGKYLLSFAEKRLAFIGNFFSRRVEKTLKNNKFSTKNIFVRKTLEGVCRQSEKNLKK